MASRSISFRNQTVGQNENLLAGKKVAKLVSGPVVRRAALGEISNKASLAQRSVSDVGKLKKTTETFKKPLALKNKNVQNENIPPKNTSKCDPIQECSMVSVDTSCSVSQDMSVVEQEPQKDAVAEETKVENKKDTAVEDLAEAFSTKCLTVVDIDADDKDNPQLVSEYVNDIYAYLRSLENKTLVRRRYLDGHTVTARMRTILIDWLVQVHMRFNLMQETLYLTMAILDRYMQLMPDTPKEEVQLVGITAMFLASKYEEMYCSEIGDFVFISDKAYSKQQIRKMEIEILKTLDYNVSMPLPLHFLRRNSKAAQVDGSQHTLAKYLMELCLPDYNMCHYKASEIAAAALYLTLKLTSSQYTWSDTITYYSGYSEGEVLPIVCKMAQCVKRSFSSSHQAIPQKYRSSKHLKISELPELQGSVIKSLAAKAASYS